MLKSSRSRCVAEKAGFICCSGVFGLSAGGPSHTHTHTDCRFRRQCEVTPGVVDVDLLTGTSRVHAVFLLAMLTWCAAAGSSSTCSLRRFEIHFFHINNKWKRFILYDTYLYVSYLYKIHSFLFIKKKKSSPNTPDMRAAIFEPESLQWIR